MQLDSESFLADLRRKGYESLATLLTAPTITFLSGGAASLR